ncbi:MAG TPA: hypothetical protein DCP32_11385 [Anaerolineaceae bacterium]|nr:hypothetical protein [Anaerolineaceae bacterium]
MPSYEINIKTKDDPRGIQSATEETNKLTDAMGKLLERAAKKQEYAAAKEAISGMSDEEKEAALSAYKMAAANETAKLGLTNLEKAVAGTRSTIGGLNTDITLFGKNVGTSADLLSGMGVSIPLSPMMAFGSLIKETGAFIGESISDYTAYVEEVDRIATYSGMASEETSRLIQVGDDLRIEVKTIEMALKAMADNGTTPSIAGLAELSNRYIAIGDPLLRAQFLTDNFSKSGVEMARIMELGGDAIKNLTDDVSEYMVITGKSKEEAEAFLASQDNFKDQWQAVGYQIGQTFIPPATDALNLIIKSNEAVDESGASWMRFIPFLSQAQRGFLTTKQYLEETTGTVKAQSGEVDKLGNSWSNATAEVEGYINTTRGNIYDRPNYHAPGSEGYNPGGYARSGNRAAGGLVKAGHLYGINENKPWTGPEYFLAPTDGMVIPSRGAAQAAMGGGGGPTPIQFVYAPQISLADRAEVERVFLPIVESAVRSLGVKS